MKNIKRSIMSIVALALTLSIIPIRNVNATNIDDIIAKELKIAIVSGDGTGDHPYVVDYDKAPYFKKYMENINAKVMYALQGAEEGTGIKPLALFDGILVGTKHTNQTKGGSWLYKSNAPTTTSNGNVWMKAITYQSVTDTKETYRLINDSYQKNKFDDVIKTAITKPYSQAYSMIVKSGITGAAASAMLRALGKVNGVFTVASCMGFVHDYFRVNKYRDAVNAKDGMIHAEYNTSYQGSWYSHKGEDAWTTANTAYEPGIHYGKGIYRSN